MWVISLGPGPVATAVAGIIAEARIGSLAQNFHTLWYNHKKNGGGKKKKDSLSWNCPCKGSQRYVT